jgi:hypothetical protein
VTTEAESLSAIRPERFNKSRTNEATKLLNRSLSFQRACHDTLPWLISFSLGPSKKLVMPQVNTIFLSYRRKDTQDVAGRLFDALVEYFGRQRVFKDVDSIPIGSEFRRFIVEQIAQSIVVVLIGPLWASSRLDDPNDFVRMEIESALELNVPIVPTLVTNAQMPSREELPESIRRLVDRHGTTVRPDPDFHTDAKRLIYRLDELLPAGRSLPAPSTQLLDDLLENCQLWYNEIVSTISKIVQTLRDRKLETIERQFRIEAINFNYQHTRTYLPKVLSARRALSEFEGTAKLAEALDDFLSVTVIEANDKEFSPYCRPPFSHALELDDSDKRWGLSLEDKFAWSSLYYPLHRVGRALQRLSNEILSLKTAQNM